MKAEGEIRFSGKIESPNEDVTWSIHIEGSAVSIGNMSGSICLHIEELRHVVCFVDQYEAALAASDEILSRRGLKEEA